MRSGKIERNQFKYESKMEFMLCNWQFYEEHRHFPFANKPILLAGKVNLSFAFLFLLFGKMLWINVN